MSRNTVERNRERTTRVMEALFDWQEENKGTGLALLIGELAFFSSILIMISSIFISF